MLKMSILYTSSLSENVPVCLNIDPESKCVTVNGKRCDLTNQEYSLLYTLACHPDCTVSRDQLLLDAWGYLSPGVTRTVDVHIQRLRRKLGCGCIETVYRRGYRLLAQPA